MRRIERKRPERPLYFGTDFHKLLEVRNDPAELKRVKSEIHETFYELPPSWQADLGENYPEDVLNIFADYQEVYKDVRQPQVTERPFELEVGKHKGEPIVFVGKIDELYLLKRQGKKTVIIGEHKTFSQKPSAETLILNTQKCLYAKAVQFLKGVLPEKVKWDYIRSKPAAEPIWLEKTKRFSRASSKSITPMSWRRACEARGVTDPQELLYGEVYAGNTGDFFFQVELDIDPTMVETLWEGYLYTAKQIIQLGEKNKTRVMNRDCSWCSYKDICYAEMTGGEVEYIISRDYTERRPG